MTLRNPMCYYPLAGNANAGVGSLGAMTAVNSPTYADVTGVGTMAVLVAASSQRFTLADSASWNFQGVSWCIGLLAVRNATAATRSLISQNTGVGNRAWVLNISTTHIPGFTIRDSLDASTLLNHTAVMPTTPTWLFFGYDRSTGLQFIDMNGAVVTGNLGTGYTIANPTGDIQVGASASSFHWGGNSGRIAVWSGYVPTREERLIWSRRITQGYTPSNMPLNPWWKQQQAV